MMALGALPTGRLVAVGGSAWISDDGGRAWRRTADAFGNSLARAVAVFDDRIVAVGSDADSGDGSIWASSDGMTWETAVADGEIFSGVELGAVTSLGDSLVVAGRRSDPQGLHESPVSAVTKDLADWQVVEVSPSAGRINSLLHTGMRLLAVGVSDLDAPNGQQPAGVWTLR